MKKLVSGSLVTALLLGSSAAFAGPTQASFTPTGYKYPIMKVSLSKADFTGEVVLYECAGETSADCLVDLADEDALANLSNEAQDVELADGEYTQLVMTMCPAGTTGSDTTTVSVLGSVTVDGDELVTNATAPGGMSDTGEAEFTDISFGCGRVGLTLQKPIVASAGAELELTLLVDLTSLVWTDAGASPGMGGCKADGSTLPDVCTAIPNIVPYVGAGTPHFERYLISHLAEEGEPLLEDANAAVNLAVNEDDEVFWVIVQPFYTETSPSWVDADKGGGDYNTQLRILETNDDGSLHIQTGGGVEDDRVGFASFERELHDGICKNEEPASPEWFYRAFPQE